MQEAYDKLVEMIADVAVMATERHLEVLALIKGQQVEMSQMKADMSQMRADTSQVKADVAQVKADVSSLKAKIVAMEFAAEQRHDELLDAIRATRGVHGAAFAL